MTTTLYISGPMHGLPYNNFPAFEDAAKRLRSVGYKVLSPSDNPQGLTRASYMKLDHQNVCKADGVATLDKFHYSPGARSEINTALDCEIPIAPLEWWINLRLDAGFTTPEQAKASSDRTLAWVQRVADMVVNKHIHADDPRPSVDLGVLQAFYEAAALEQAKAMGKHAPMHTAHEAYAVIREEVDELWDEVKKRQPDEQAMRLELIQIAAMCGRAVHDLNLLPPAPGTPEVKASEGGAQ